MTPPNRRSLLAKRSHPPGFNSQTSNQPKSFSYNTSSLTDSFPASRNNPWSEHVKVISQDKPLAWAYPQLQYYGSFSKSHYAFRTQEWFNLARGDVLRLCRTLPLVSFLLGWFARLTHRPDDRGSTHLWNVGRHPIKNMAVHPRRLWTSYSPQWEPEISQYKRYCNVRYRCIAKSKAVPLHAIMALWGRGGIAPTHSWPRH
jgi:hypothetical protein